MAGVVVERVVALLQEQYGVFVSKDFAAQHVQAVGLACCWLHGPSARLRGTVFACVADFVLAHSLCRARAMLKVPGNCTRRGSKLTFTTL